MRTRQWQRRDCFIGRTRVIANWECVFQSHLVCFIHNVDIRCFVRGRGILGNQRSRIENDSFDLSRSGPGEGLCINERELHGHHYSLSFWVRLPFVDSFSIVLSPWLAGCCSLSNRRENILSSRHAYCCSDSCVEEELYAIQYLPHGSSFIKPTVFKDYLDWRVGVWLYQTALMHRSGKTALLRRFITNSFGNDYYSTIGATYIKKTIEYKDSSIELQAWPIAIWWRLDLGYGRAREVSGLGKQLLPRSGCVHFGLWYNKRHLFK